MARNCRGNVMGMVKRDSERFRQVCSLIGFAFIQSWQMVVYASPFIAPYDDLFQMGILAPYPYYINVAIVIATPLVILLKKNVADEERSLVAPVATLSLVGSGLLLLHSFLGSYGFLGFAAGALIAGFCDVFLLFSWIALWSTLASSGTLKSICLSYVFAFVLYQLFAVAPHFVQNCFVVVALPASAFCLVFGGDALRRSFPTTLGDLACPHIQKQGALLASVAILHGIFGISQVCNRTIGGPPTTEFFLGSVLPAGALILGVTILVSTRRTPEKQLKVLYESVFLSIVCYVVLIVAPARPYPDMVFGFMRFAMFALDALTILVATDYAYRAKISVWKVFGPFFLIGRAASVVGFLVMAYGISHVSQTNELIVYCLLGSLVIAAVVQMIVFTCQDLIDIMAVSGGAERENIETASSQVEAFSEAFGLSPRETEVLEYLLKGYTVAHLSEKLYISANTGKRHVSNIYRKLGIYNKQSLIEMFTKYSIAH